MVIWLSFGLEKGWEKAVNYCLLQDREQNSPLGGQITDNYRLPCAFIGRRLLCPFFHCFFFFVCVCVVLWMETRSQSTKYVFYLESSPQPIPFLSSKIIILKLKKNQLPFSFYLQVQQGIEVERHWVGEMAH